ncbi:preprotein translocase subunit SecE [Deltaproteobacteria bacterium TL4]
MFNRFKQFLEDVRSEFKRVHWPSREETLRSTSVVLALSMIIAIFLGIADLGLSNAMKFIISG